MDDSTDDLDDLDEFNAEASKPSWTPEPMIKFVVYHKIANNDQPLIIVEQDLPPDSIYLGISPRSKLGVYCSMEYWMEASPAQIRALYEQTTT